MKSKYSFQSMEQYFTSIVRNIEITRKDEALKVAGRLLQNKVIYQEIEASTKIPWYLIASIHSKECSARMDRYLGNGQRLDQVTTIVPKGRGPFKSFAEGAIDALRTQEHLVRSIDISDGWSMAECLWFAMRYNGTGYNARGMNSPYVFCGTSAYTRGGYPRDGHFDPNHVVKNIGVYPLMWGIKQIQGFLNEEDRENFVAMTAEEKPELFEGTEYES